jgi:hypothetical protein
MDRPELAVAKLRAEDTLEHLTVAMWSGEATFNRDYHLNRAKECLAGLAEKLGYRIEKIEAPAETSEAA